MNQLSVAEKLPNDWYNVLEILWKIYATKQSKVILIA